MFKSRETYAPLEEDIHIASVVRLTSTVILKPQTSKICYAKARHNIAFPAFGIYQVSALKEGHIASEPGLMVSNSVGKLNEARRIPVFIVNNTNRTFCIRRGSVVGQMTQIKTRNISAVNLATEHDTTEGTTLDKTDINVPSEHKDDITKLVEENSDLFAQKDSDLGRTDTVKIKIDTGNEPPIRLKAYRAPLNNRKIINEAVNEMF